MRKLGAFIGLLALGSVLGPAEAVTTTNDVVGALGRAEHTCLSPIPLFTPLEDCTVTGEADLNVGVGDTQLGPLASGGYYAVGTEPDPTIGSEPGDGKVNLAITGTVTVDDNNTAGGDGLDDLISFSLVIEAGVKNTSTSAGSMNESWTSYTQVLDPYNVNAATPNGSGGFDYVIGEQGIMFDICTLAADAPVAGAEGCFGESEFGSGATNVWTRPGVPGAWAQVGLPNIVNFAAGGGDPGLNDNAGAVTTGNAVDYVCVDIGGLDPDCALVDGIGEDGVGYTFLSGGAHWDNLVMTISTDASGNIISAKGYFVYMYDIVLLTGYNSWVGGSFSLVRGNILPVADDDTVPLGAGVAVNMPFNIDVLANDTELGELPTTVVIDNGSFSDGGSATVNGDNTIAYTSNNFAGTETFTYMIRDATPDDSNAATVTVNINNLLPLAVDDASSTDVGLDVIVSVLDNDLQLGDTPVPLVPLVTSTSNELNGTTTIIGNNVTFSPVAIGLGGFDYTITDANGDTSTASVSIAVADPNIPTASDDSALTDTGVTVNIDVLLNDAGLGDTPLTVATTLDPANGSTVDNPDNTIDYIPDPGFAGADSFEYTVTDSTLDTSTATVSVTVNDLPVAVDDDAGTVDVGSSTAISVLANDTGLSDTPLQGVVPTAPANGTATAMGCTAVGTCVVTYVNDGTPGPDTFDYTVTDTNGDPATGTVSIDVNDLPVANDDVASTLAETLVSINVLTNDSGLGDAPVVVTVTTMASNGNAAEQPDNTVDYTPAAGISGADSFVYTLTDANGDSDTATVTVNVAEPNVPMAVDDAATTNEDVAVTINVLANDLELDDTPITLTLAAGSTPANGSVTINGSPGTNVAAISLTYTPDADFFGTDTFDYTVSDADGDSGAATVTITVTEVVGGGMDEVLITIPSGSSSLGPWALALLLFAAIPVLRRRKSAQVH